LDGLQVPICPTCHRIAGDATQELNLAVAGIAERSELLRAALANPNFSVLCVVTNIVATRLITTRRKEPGASGSIVETAKSKAVGAAVELNFLVQEGQIGLRLLCVMRNLVD
jgi:hypothetical protein